MPDEQTSIRPSGPSLQVLYVFPRTRASTLYAETRQTQHEDAIFRDRSPEALAPSVESTAMWILGAARASEREVQTRFHGSDGATPEADAPRALPSAYLWISIVGVCGFVGLLVASHYSPLFAAPLRVAALVWFLGFGVLRGLLVGRR